VVNEDRRAYVRPLSRLYVAPAIADHDAVREIGDWRLEEQAGLRLPAWTCVSIVVITDSDFVERKTGRERRVDGLDDATILLTPRDVWLVGDDDETVARRLEPTQGLSGVSGDRDVVDAVGRARFAVPDKCLIEDAVTVQKHRGHRHGRAALIAGRSLLA
jgi:hypothetical protein